MLFCHVVLSWSLTLTLTLMLTLYSQNERHNEEHNVPPVEWNVEIRLLFLPVFVAYGLKVRLPVFVATSFILKTNSQTAVSCTEK